MRSRNKQGAFWVAFICLHSVSSTLAWAFGPGTPYGKRAVPMTQTQLLEISRAQSPSAFKSGDQEPVVKVRIRTPAVPAVYLSWSPEWYRLKGGHTSRFQVSWYYTPSPGIEPMYPKEGLSSEYREILIMSPERAVPPIQKLLALIAEVPPQPFTVTEYGYPERPKYDKELVNIEVILSYMTYLEVDRKANRYGPPSNAVESPVYLISCDPRSENAQKKDSYYKECQAILEHLKKEFLAPARKLFPEIPETRIGPAPTKKLTDKEKTKVLE